MEKRIKNRLVIGPLMMLAGIALPFLWSDAPSALVSGLVAFGVVLILYGIRMMRDSEVHKKDERTKKLGSYAAAYSWQLTMIAIAVLFWVDYLAIAEIPVETVLGLLLFWMTFTLIIFRWYFMRKGDV